MNYEVAPQVQTKKTYSTSLTRLILRVKKLEKTIKTSKARRRARIVLLEDEDATEDSSKQGRKISDIDTDPTISLVQRKLEEEERNHLLGKEQKKLLVKKVLR
ncbi:hypothetical protein Tco_1558605, partial [Tanacetum coccineum]